MNEIILTIFSNKIKRNMVRKGGKERKKGMMKEETEEARGDKRK